MKFKINPYVAVLILNIPMFFIIRFLHIPAEYFAIYFLIVFGIAIYRQYWRNAESKK